MILIDKNQINQPVVLTLTESKTVDNPKYLMVLRQDAYPNEIFRLFLPANTSQSSERYDLFQMDTEDFKGMDIGYYTFTIYEQDSLGNIENENLLGEAIEVGKMYIIDTKPVPVNDEYIVYKGV